MDIITSYVLGASGWLLPLLALWLLARCMRSLLREHYEPETWGYLKLNGGDYISLRHFECTLGRSKSSDAVIADPSVSRLHAALVRLGEGRWRVYDLGSRGGTFVEGEEVGRSGAELGSGDKLALASAGMEFIDLDEEERAELAEKRTPPGRFISPSVTFLILTAFQALLALEHAFYGDGEYAVDIVLAFSVLIAVEWTYYIVMRIIRRSGFEAEAIAFFLSGIGLSVAASSVPEDMLKQVLLLLAGIFLFIILGWWLRDLKRTRALRWPTALAAMAFLALNLLTSRELFGAKNWIYVAGFSLQPSEFVKAAYIYAGGATLNRLFHRRNILAFIGFSAVCVCALALMGDFGTALIFFGTFLVISFMRSGSIATVILAVSSAAIAGGLVLSAKPYIATRFASWGHIWEDPWGAGFQQTKALAAVASGGLFGKGAGKGFLSGIFAADTDMVFCFVTEELGLVVALCAVAAIIVLAAFVVKHSAQGRSSFYVIAACAAVSMMMIQMGLNIFGSVDILPFTGVTFPFVSRGGSSLISCWMLLAFIKAADTRRNASFSVPMEHRGSGKESE